MTDRERTTQPMAVTDEYIAHHREHQYPTCDTCELPAVWSESLGWLHSTPTHPFGVPPAADTTGHEVTAKTWWQNNPRRTAVEEQEGSDR